MKGKLDMGIKLRIWGDFACFTRPEFKVERMSYEIITPSAAKGVIESIYWKPEITWFIDKIHVLKPVRFISFKRNEVLSSKISRSLVKRMMSGGDDVGIDVSKHSTKTQRAGVILSDVEYIIEAHFELMGGENAAKHVSIFNRRAANGQYKYTPCLGLKELPANFELVNDIPNSPLIGYRDLGIMFYGFDYHNDLRPLFFHAIMENGIVDVAAERLKRGYSL